MPLFVVLKFFFGASGFRKLLLLLDDDCGVPGRDHPAGDDVPGRRCPKPPPCDP